ncbi:Pectin lyase fold/virulence factor [Naviculisporaceae sp. PSN 640]
MKVSLLTSLLLAAAAELATAFWYNDIDHTTSNVRGYAPDLDPDYSYPIYRAVAAGDGAGIQRAINEATTPGSSRNGLWFASQPRVVYLPPGTYDITSTINMRTDTILMGDAANPPTLRAVGPFNGNTLLNGKDPAATDDRGELSFTVGLKNIVLDTRSISSQQFTALYWGVAQGSQLQNVKIVMPPSASGVGENLGHTGIRMGRGSTLGLADVRIEGGQTGILVQGHQQALFKSIYFYRNTVGMLITAGATFSIANPTFDTVGFGVLHTGGYPYISIIDGKSINSGVTFRTTSWPNLLIENLEKDTTSNIVEGPSTNVLSGRSYVGQYSYGNTVDRSPIYGDILSTTHTRPAGLTPGPGNRYLYMKAPNYATNPVSDFLNIKDPAQNGGRTIKGDNTIDESAALNAILQLAASSNKIAYFPFGKYRVDSTLTIPPGSRIVGEVWATIVGSGNFFKNAASPQPVVRVGSPGQVGTAQISDMRFTISDVLPGAIILQVNMAPPSGNPGGVAIWNSLVTVGGTRGASALASSCNSDGSAQCRAAFLGIHLSNTSSTYLENVWNWVADHTAEDFTGGSRIAGKGGVLVQSTQPTWLHALGSEHWWLYQLNLHRAQNVAITLLQSETNYDQGDNNLQLPPAPWTNEINTPTWGDPNFNSICANSPRNARCRMGFANYITGGSNIFTYASASWAFFSGPNYSQCAGGSGQYSCQEVMHRIEQTPSNFKAFGLCAKDARVVVRLGDGRDIEAQPDFTGSWSGGGGDVGRYTP